MGFYFLLQILFTQLSLAHDHWLGLVQELSLYLADSVLLVSPRSMVDSTFVFEFALVWSPGGVTSPISHFFFPELLGYLFHYDSEIQTISKRLNGH